MDPLSQGVVGASASQVLAKPGQFRVAALLGFLSGLAPDLDVLIRSGNDPLLFLEYHRQFTHALVFVPIGGLLCSLVLTGLLGRSIKRAGLGFAHVCLFCTAGYATHALLDACTTYGTILLWPFSHARIAWNTVSVVDPLFTVPLLILMLFAVVRRSLWFAWAMVLYGFAYLSLGLVQHDRAQRAAEQLMVQRGHVGVVSVKPSFGNLVVWKSVYECDGRYYIDAVRVVSEASILDGDSIEKLNVIAQFPWLPANSQQAKDIERFRWFSNGYLALDPYHPNRIIDVRYSALPNEVRGLWGIELDPAASQTQHVKWVTERPKGKESTSSLKKLWSMIVGD